MSDELTLKYIPLKQAVLWDRNPKKHELEKIKASIRRYGFKDPPAFSTQLNDGQGAFTEGNGRTLAVRQMHEAHEELPRGLRSDESGEWYIPVLFGVDATSVAMAEAYSFDHNALTAAGLSPEEQMKMWEPEALSMLRDLANSDEKPEAFSPDELSMLLGIEDELDDDEEEEQEEDSDTTPQEDLMAELVAKWAVNTGDIWQCGEHRIACGSSTDSELVARLMQGEKADLLFTSPPYANQRGYGGLEFDWDELMNGVFSVAPMKDTGQVLVNLGQVHEDKEWQPYWLQWTEHMRKIGWRRFAWYIWDQLNGLPGDWHGRLAPSYEFIFHFNKQTRNANKIVRAVSAGPVDNSKKSTKRNGPTDKLNYWGNFNNEETQEFHIPDNVIRLTRAQSHSGVCGLHPATFPVTLPEMVINSYSNDGEIVYEPFLGSGTTMLACENTGRVCRGIDIKPEYVCIALEKWLLETEIEPVRL